MTIRNYGELTSGFCGYLHCKLCIAKKRLNTFNKARNIFVCYLCEENYIKVKLWNEFKLEKKAKETELEFKKQTLINLEAQYTELNVDHDVINNEQNMKYSSQKDELKITQEEEARLRVQIDDKKKIIADLTLKERGTDKKLSDLNNLLNELHKRNKEVKELTKILCEENNMDVDFKNKTREHIIDLIASIRLKKHMKTEINIHKKNNDDKNNRKKIVYRSRINGEMYDPNGGGCRCSIF